MASANTAWIDSRNKAELLLSPARPAGRQLAKFGSLKLNFGVPSLIPGTLSKLSDITGAVRQSFGAFIDLKGAAEQLSSTLNKTLTGFEGQLANAVAGRLPQGLDPARGEFDDVPSAESFLQFSTLSPGSAIPANFKTLLDDRKAQLQSLTQRMSSIFSTSSFKGVMLRENFQRTPYPLKLQIDLPTVPFLAQGGLVAQKDDIIKDKRRFVIAGVQIGSGKPSFWSRLLSAAQIKVVPSLNPVVGQIFKDRKNTGVWSEPPSAFAAQFPYNKVQQTESGHVFELDDTPGAERVHVFHRSGSFIEMHPDGTVVYKNMKHGYDLTMGDKYVKVSGACHVSVDGNVTMHAKGDVNMQCDGEFNVQAKNDFNVYAKNINLRAKRTFSADGIKIDLRYINLPSGLMPVPMSGGFSPRINIAAIKADFPKSNIDDLLKKMAKNPLDPKVGLSPVLLNPESVATPPENPLSHPGVYIKKTLAAAQYRNRFFDTPEEAGDFEQYTAHIGLQTTLGDITDDPRKLGGRLYTIPVLHDDVSTADVTYLDFDNYKGVFSYGASFRLATTSFTLADLVDSVRYPDIIVPSNPTSTTGTGTGGTGSGGGGGTGGGGTGGDSPGPPGPRDPNDPLPPSA
jgi:hypothetical protein